MEHLKKATIILSIMDALHLLRQMELLSSDFSNSSSLDVSNVGRNIMVLANSSEVKDEQKDREAEHTLLVVKTKQMTKVYTKPCNTSSTNSNQLATYELEGPFVACDSGPSIEEGSFDD